MVSIQSDSVLSIWTSCTHLFVISGSLIVTTALFQSVNTKNYESFAWRIHIMASLRTVSSLEKTVKRVGSLNVDIWPGYVIAQPFHVCVLALPMKVEAVWAVSPYLILELATNGLFVSCLGHCSGWTFVVGKWSVLGAVSCSPLGFMRGGGVRDSSLRCWARVPLVFVIFLLEFSRNYGVTFWCVRCGCNFEGMCEAEMFAPYS
jgi:hypothetical protein